MTENASPSPLLGSKFTVTVLLVDDQAIVGADVRIKLSGEPDIIYHHCSDPTRAVQTAADLSPTVILQDLVMPEIDGLTLLKFYRAHPRLKDVPVIMLSTKEDPATKAESFAAGAHDYIVKMPDKVELIARIRYQSNGYIRLLERNEAYAELEKRNKEQAAELEQAAAYVVSLLPAPIADEVAPGAALKLSANWKYVPSTQLGGDTFGYRTLDDEHMAMYLLDVCSHGVGPALLSVQALNLLNTGNLPGVDCRRPDQVLTKLNEIFQMDRHDCLFFTIWYGVLNRRTRKLSYASGGHPPALLYGRDKVEELSTPGLAIGCMPDTKYTAREVEVPVPGKIFVFSDGVYEVHRPDGSMWSAEELAQYLARPENAGPDVIEKLYAMLREMHGEKSGLEDDFSMFRVEFNIVN